MEIVYGSIINSLVLYFSRERQRGSRDLTFAAFVVCRPPFLLKEGPFEGNAKT